MKLKSQIKLTSLTLNNFATFTQQQLNFTDGLNCLIGETGSGKSLILEALHLLLGSRTDKKYVRATCDHAVVEGVFSFSGSNITEHLVSLGYPPEDNEIIIKRVISSSGKSKSYLNFQQCSAQTLFHFLSEYIDIVGQFENQRLFNSNFQLKLLDQFIGDHELQKKYDITYRELIDLKKQYRLANSQLQDALERKDYLEYQLHELSELSPSTEDEELLLRNKKAIQDFENTNKDLFALRSLLDGEQSLRDQIQRVRALIEKNDVIFNEVTTQDDLLTACDYIDNLAYKINNYEVPCFSEDDVTYTIERLDTYQRLKSKHKCTTEQLIAIKEKITADLNQIDISEKHNCDLKSRIVDHEKSCHELASQISQRRHQYAEDFSKRITSYIRKLNMKKATFIVKITRGEELGPNGLDTVQFYAETNPGEGEFAISQIASGGELSRLLLAIRSILSRCSPISIFFFDEIDAGMGGETALLIGKQLKTIAQQSQIISITHLPQIAIHSDQLIKVEKKIFHEGNTSTRTQSLATPVDQAKMRDEVTQMAPLQ